ncbi:outer membrane protein [Devosia epidermidihirudinis]|uniref:outer membrane protein n=1 Tax=Devosia epidermidihirudinis TaxID=1293439 RepID=UPI000616F6E7|nr:outer membrane beta-barrel protein [Devosia epidermidihirudinis]
MRLKFLGLVGGLVSVLALGGSAVAQENTDWSGFYAGIFGGYGLDSDGSSGSSIGPASITIGGTALDGSLASSTGRIDGVFGGATAGYNYQHNNLVFGVEGNVGLGQLGKTNSSDLSASFTDAGNTVSLNSTERTEYDINWYSSLVGRLGLAHGNWLFTLKGGIVLADASIEATSRLTIEDPNNVIGIQPGIDLPGSSNASQVLVGTTFGFGAETMIADNVSIGAEYAYVALPDLSAPAPGVGGLLGGGGGSTFGAGIHQIKASLNYHF